MIRLYSESAYYAGVMTGFCVDFAWILRGFQWILMDFKPAKVHLAGCKSEQSLFGWLQIRAKLLWVAAETTAAIPLAVKSSVWISGLKPRKSRKSAKSTKINQNPTGIQKCVFADVSHNGNSSKFAHFGCGICAMNIYIYIQYLYRLCLNSFWRMIPKFIYFPRLCQ